MKQRSVILWLLGRVRRRIPMIVCMLAACGGNALFGVLFALGTKGVVDSAISGEKEAFFSACIIQLTIICAMLLCITVFRYLSDKLVTELDRDWKRSLLSGLLRGEYAQVNAYHSGELVNRLNNDVRILNDTIVSTLPGIAAIMVRLVSVVVVLASMAMKFTLAIALGGLVAVIVTGILRQKLKNLNKQVSQTEGKVLSYLQESMERLLVIQAMDLADEVDRRADLLFGQRFHIQRRKRKLSLFANTGISVLFQGAGFAALVWCAFHLLQGEMTYGTLMAVTQLVTQLQAPFLGLSGIMTQYAAMSAAGERLMELEQIDREPEDAMEDPQGYYARMERIGARDISFAYEDDEVFHNASFSLPKGAFATITGASGIGKSTLLKLMLGVFKPTGGTLYVEGEGEERTLSRNTRGLFAYVPQGNFLFSGTLRENIVISKPEATQEEIDEAIHISCMDQFLPQLPDGLESLIGENGAGLSEGQVQRLAIARAVLSGAPILLLDEATSALDSETEQAVLQRIAQLSNRTCIAVTHRPAALELSDWHLEVANKEITAYKSKV